MIWFLTRILPMKLVGLVLLALVLALATGLADPIAWIESQVITPAVTALEDWLSNTLLP